MLAYEAKKNPKIAEMLDNISMYSVEEIQTAPFMKWIRQAILAKKKYIEEKIISFCTFNPNFTRNRRWKYARSNG